MNPVKPDDWLTREGSPAAAVPAAGLGDDSAGRHLPRVRARRPRHRQPVSRGRPCRTCGGKLQLLDEPGRPDIKQSNRGPGHRRAHRRSGAQHHQDAPERSATCGSSAPTTSRATIARRAAPAATWCTRTTATRALRALCAATATTAKASTADPTISEGPSPGHPLKHEFTRAIPSSQCMICHMHQPNIFVNSFYGYTMWDYESDAPSCGPRSSATRRDDGAPAHPRPQSGRRCAARQMGRSGFPEATSRKLNPTLKDTQFADYHGHGWNFRAVFKRDRKGTLLDKDGKRGGRRRSGQIQSGKAGARCASRIHVDVGMQCVDCHFAQDSHGNGHIYGEVAAAIEIDCKDCHGTADRYPTLFDLGAGGAAAAAPTSRLMRTPDGRKRFEWRDGKLLPALGDRSRRANGTVSLVQGLGQSEPSALQREGRARQADARRARTTTTRSSWGPDVPAGRARARRRQDGLLHLPPVVDHELRRLPPADRGQLEDRAASLTKAA